MKSRIYKSLISILIISMLTMSGIASARPAPYPTPTSTAEAVQDQRLTNLETNDTNQNTVIQDLQANIQNFRDWAEKQVANLNVAVGDLTTSVNDLTTRVTNIENNPYPAMFMGWEEDIPICAPGETKFICREDIVNISFYVPEDTYVLISSSGKIAHFVTNPITLTLDVTADSQGAQYIGPKDITEEKYLDANNTAANGFSISNTLKLTAGNYTAHLKGGTTETTTASEVSIGVIAIQKGKFQ